MNEIINRFNLLLFCCSLILLLLFGASNESLASGSCASVPSNLVGWWKAENNANDVFGINTGTLQYGASFVSGKVGQAFSFDGLDDYVNIPSSPLLNVSNSITVAAWVSHTTGNPRAYEDMVLKGRNSYGLQFDATGHFWFMLYSAGYKTLSSGVKPEAGQWYHVVGTYDYNASEMKIYINGVLKGTKTLSVNGSVNAINTNNEPLSFGYKVASDNNYLNGAVDEVQIYNRALTAAEVLSIYNAGDMGVCTPDIAVDPLFINTTIIQGALQKSFYSVTFGGQGGLAPLIWSKSAGAFPAGIDIDPQTGILSGTTPVCGAFNFTLQLADSSPSPTTVHQAYQLTVACANNYDLVGNVGADGISVTLTGSAQQTVTSGAGGTYMFQHLTNGNYTVTPTKTGYWFTPATRSVTVNNLDTAGVNFTATADNTPPTGSITINGGATYTKSTTTTLGLSATDTGSGVVTMMQFSSDNGTTWTTAENYAAIKSWNLSAGDGPKTISVKYKDKAGNWSSISSATITLDTVIPDTIIENKPAALSNSVSPTFTFTSNETSATFECKLDGASFTVCPTPKNYSGINDGLHSIAVRAKDVAGNIDPTPATYNWTIDATAPSATITDRPTNPSKVPWAYFTFTSSDASATFECNMDTGTFAACSNPLGYVNLAEGSHTFQLRSKDAAENTTTSSYTWEIDLTPPDTNIDSKPAALTGSATASFNFSSTETVTTFECQLDGSAFEVCTSPNVYTSLGMGEHTFAVRSTDASGNVDTSPTVYTWERGTVLGLSFSGVGAGTVTSIPAGLACTGACSSAFVKDSQFTLLATPDIYSYFAGWSGGGCSSTGNCPMTLTTDTGVTATFSVMAPLRIPGLPINYYQTFLNAYADAPLGQAVTIQARIVELQENISLNRNVTVNFNGGYDGDYSDVSGFTTIHGALKIRAGRVNANRLIIK